MDWGQSVERSIFLNKTLALKKSKG